MKIVDEIKLEIMDMDEKKIILFIFSLLSRQKQTFEGLVDWNCENQLVSINMIFDDLKGFMSNMYESNMKYTRVPEEYLDWNTWGEVDECILENYMFFLETLNAFIGQLSHTNDIDYAFIQCNFEMLQNLLFNFELWSGEDEESFVQNEYVQVEKERELRDIKLIKDNNYHVKINSDETIVDREIFMV